MLSACMIVKNESDILTETLPGLAQAVDELIIVDTGSTDNTIAVAERFGAQVLTFQWVDDFAAARNRSIEAATQEWVLWIDADEYMQAEDVIRLKQHLAGIPAEQQGVMLPIYQCKRGETACERFYSRVKVFRNHQGIRFTRPINEQVTLPDGTFLSAPYYDEVKIYHWGDIGISQEKQQSKAFRNIALLKRSIEQHPHDINYVIQIAKSYIQLRDYESSLTQLNQALHTGVVIPPHLFEEFAMLLLLSLEALNRNEELESLLESLTRERPAFIYAQRRYAVHLLKKGNMDRAEQVAMQILELPEPSAEGGQYADLKGYRYWPHYILGAIADARSDKEKAMHHYQKALEYEQNGVLAKRLQELQDDTSTK